MKDFPEIDYKRGMQVFFRCTNPATGFIKRLYKDGLHADVTWCCDANIRQTKKTRLDDIKPLTYVLNNWLLHNPRIRTLEKEMGK